MINIKKRIALVLMSVVHLNAYSFSGGFGGMGDGFFNLSGFDNLFDSLFVGDPSVDIARIINPQNVKNIKSKDVRNKLFIQLLYCLALAEAKEPFKRDAEEALEYAGRRIGHNESLYFKHCKDQLMSAFEKAEEYGITDEDSLKQLKEGILPQAKKGKYKKTRLVVHEIIPTAICPELSNEVFNLSLLSEKERRKTKDVIGFASDLRKDELLSDQGLSSLLKSDEAPEQ